MRINDVTPFHLARLCLLNCFILAARATMWGVLLALAVLGLQRLDAYFVTDLERWLLWGSLALCWLFGRVPYATDPRPAEVASEAPKPEATPAAAPVDL